MLIELLLNGGHTCHFNNPSISVFFKNFENNIIYTFKSNKCYWVGGGGDLLFQSLPNGRGLVFLLCSEMYFITISHNHGIIIFLTSS